MTTEIHAVRVESNRYAPRVRAGEVLTTGMGVPEPGDDVLVRLTDGSLVLMEWPEYRSAEFLASALCVALVTGIYAVRSGMTASEVMS